MSTLDFLAPLPRTDSVKGGPAQPVGAGVVVIGVVEVGVGLSMVEDLVTRLDQQPVLIGIAAHPLADTGEGGPDPIAL